MVKLLGGDEFSENLRESTQGKKKDDICEYLMKNRVLLSLKMKSVTHNIYA